MTSKQQLAQYSADLNSTYNAAVAVLATQPQQDRGAVIVLETLNGDLDAHAYGTPGQWADMLVSVAIRNEDFMLALLIAYHRIELNARMHGAPGNERAEDDN